MLENYGIQELTSFCVKAISPTQIGTRIFGVGETLLYLTNVEIAKVEEGKGVTEASGGYVNPPLVRWLSSHDINFVIRRGVLSQKDLSFMLDSNFLNLESILVDRREEKTIQSNGTVLLKEVPVGNYFCYNENGDKYLNIPIDNKTLSFGTRNAGKMVTIDYQYAYQGAQRCTIGDNYLSNAIVKVEAKLLLKDDINGIEKTGILTIPRANLLGSMNLIIGEKAAPIVGDLVCYSIQSKTETKGRHTNYTFTMFNEDIDSL